VEAIEVEIFSSNQGSRKVNVEKSSIAFSSRSILITFESSEASKEAHPGSIEAFAKLPFVAIVKVKRCTLSFSRSFPPRNQFFRPLNLIIISIPIVRRRDVTPPSSSATVFMTPRPHELTIVELCVVYTRYRAGQMTVAAPQWL
jgi:hypothetical protein